MSTWGGAAQIQAFKKAARRKISGEKEAGEKPEKGEFFVVLLQALFFFSFFFWLMRVGSGQHRLIWLLGQEQRYYISLWYAGRAK